MSGSTILLIDVMPLLYRGHFAFASKPRLTSKGVNTSAIFLFASSIQRMVAAEGVTHAALAMDVTPTFRHARFPAYKAQREKMPEDIAASIPMAEEFARAMRIPFLRVPGFEADDIIGTLAARADAAGMSARIFTPDKDFAQLVTPNVTLSRPSKVGEGTDDYTPDQVRIHWGVSSPERIIDLLALQGDAVDNIPGVAGVGGKTAVKLLSEYGSLESVLLHADEIKGKLGERIREHAEDARLSYWLATICRDAPIAESLDDFALQSPDLDALDAFLTKYELFGLKKKFGLAPSEASPEGASPNVQGGLFDFFAPSKPGPEAKKDESAGDLFQFFAAKAAPSSQPLVPRPQTSPQPPPPSPQPPDSCLAALESATAWAFALEEHDGAMQSLSFALAGNPVREWRFESPDDALLARFRPLFEREDVTKTGHDVKRGIRLLRCRGIRLSGPFHDTVLAHYVLDSAARHTLEALCAAMPDTVASAATDAGRILALDIALRAAVHEAGALDALERCEEPLAPILADMEAEGIRLDPSALTDFREELASSIADLDRRIHAMVRDAEAAKSGAAQEADTLFGAFGLVPATSSEFDIGSARQLGRVLFEVLGLPAAGKTATGQYDTSEEVLQGLVPMHPVVPLILDWKARTKLKSTYVDKLPACIDPADGRIHTTFQQALTETGRLSSDNPNLQNIPVRTDLGKRIRAAFVPRDADHVLLSADYSQIELRILASMSGDAAMSGDFRKGSDIHAETAARVHGIPVEEVTREMRSQAKRVNFGIVYGISAFGLGQRLGIPRKQASDLIAAVKAAYPGIDRFMKESVETARETGCARTLLGRRRPIRDIASRNGTLRAAAERLAVNTPVQGSAADVIKLAMVDIHRELRRRGLAAKMVLQIHDELVFDVPVAEVDAVRALVEERMTQVLPSLSVPLVVEIGVGKNWLDAH